MAVTGPFLAEAFAKITATADPGQMRRAANAAIAAGLSGINPSIPVQLGTTKALADAKVLQAQLRKTFDGISEGLNLKTKEAQLQFARLGASADRLQHKLSNQNISLEGVSKARLQLLGLEVQADRLRRKFATTGLGGTGLRGLLGKGVGALFGAGGGAAGAASSALPALGGVSLPVIAVGAVAATTALLALTPAIIGTVVALTGFAGFAALAAPVVTGLASALTGLKTATDAYQVASANLNVAIHKSPADLALYKQTIHGLEPDLQNAARLLTNQNVRWQNLTPSMQKSVVALSDNKGALKNLLPDQKLALAALLKQKAAWDSLTPAQQGIAKSMQGLGGQFSKLQKAIQPQVYKALATSLRIVKDLFPAFKPLVEAAGKALDGFLKKIANWLESPGGHKFIHWLETTGPKDIANFAKAVWTIAVVFGDVAHFMYDQGQRIIQHLKDIRDFFTRVLPNAVMIAHDAVRLFFDRMGIDAVSTVVAILGAFSHLPFIGKSAGKARDAVNAQLIKMQGDAARTSANMQASLNRLHGKTITVTEHGVGNFTIRNAGPGQRSSGSPQGGRAAGWLVPGTGSGDSVPAWLTPGELVVPKGMVRAGLVDHLRGMVPGFAAGGLARAGDPGVFSGSSLAGWDRRFEQQFTRAMEARMTSAMKSAIASARAAAASFGGVGGPGGGAPSANRALAFSLYRNVMGPADWAAWQYVEMREAGWNQFARNPSSGAYGIPQALPPGKMGAAANPPQSNPRAQITWMWNYMAQTYGGPQGAAAHEAAFNWYHSGGRVKSFDNGGWLGPGVTLASNMTGHAERVGNTPLKATLEVKGSGSMSEADRFMINWLQRIVRNHGGGSVELTFGSA